MILNWRLLSGPAAQVRRGRMEPKLLAPMGRWAFGQPTGMLPLDPCPSLCYQLRWRKEPKPKGGSPRRVVSGEEGREE